MLAGAEADLEPEIALRRREEGLRIEAAALRQREAQGGQQIAQQIALAGPQLPAAAPAIDDAPALRGLCRRFLVDQAKADFSCGTRSSRSQEKPPSGSGARPKWP